MSSCFAGRKRIVYECQSKRGRSVCNNAVPKSLLKQNLFFLFSVFLLKVFLTIIQWIDLRKLKLKKKLKSIYTIIFAKRTLVLKLDR